MAVGCGIGTHGIDVSDRLRKDPVNNFICYTIRRASNPRNVQALRKENGGIFVIPSEPDTQIKPPHFHFLPFAISTSCAMLDHRHFLVFGS